MSRWAYVNGAYVRHGDAAVHIEDRGYQFADAVYEVWSVMGGKLADAPGHFARLFRSLGELSIDAPMSEAALRLVLRELVRRNRIDEGQVYLQVSRGVARRDHLFPKNTPPAVVATARHVNRAAQAASSAAGIGVITTPEIRWGRCDIKTVGLLPNLWPSRRPRRAARLKPGSSTPTAWSPRPRPPTSGSSTRKARCEPATPRPISSRASPARP
jgi:D-alanine transaminase